MKRVSGMFLAVVAALALVGVACGGGGGTGATPTGGATTGGATTGGATQGGAVSLDAADNEFTPATITASAGQEVMVTNMGAALHNFSVTENGVDFDSNPGESETEDAFEGLAAGTYTFFCKYHQAQGMEGTVTITG